MSLKDARGLIEICELLFGVRYGLSGDTITELANTVAGGKAKVCHFVLSTKAVASVVLSVVRATVINRPLILGLMRGKSCPSLLPAIALTCDKGMAGNRQD